MTYLIKTTNTRTKICPATWDCVFLNILQKHRNPLFILFTYATLIHPASIHTMFVKNSINLKLLNLTRWGPTHFTYTKKSNIINFTKFRQHFALVSEVHEMKVINHDHNQVCIQRTTQISLNRNFVKFMHKPQCMHYNKLWKIILPNCPIGQFKI